MSSIHLVGDSTCAEKPASKRPETGWGECFSCHVKPGWTVVNRAVDGMSSKLFFDSGRMDVLLSSIAAEDWVLIQFGHNEGKVDIERHTEPWTSFHENLAVMVSHIASRGARVVLASPIARRKFSQQEEHWFIQDTHGQYPVAMKAVAQVFRVPFVDMTGVTTVWLENLGPQRSKACFNWLEPGVEPNYPQGCMDDTHLNTSGAAQVAALTATSIARLGCGFPCIAS